MHESVYKICTRDAWSQASSTGELSASQADLRDGYVHLSARDQIRGTLLKHFRDQHDLVLLEVPVQRLPSGALAWEPSTTGELFPHLHSGLRTDDVARVHDIPAEADDLEILLAEL